MERIDIEKLLREGHTIRVHPQGYSMYPMFVPGRDEAVIAPAAVSELRRSAVLLYRRPGGILVLHRLVKRTPEGLYFTGDNQSAVEGPLAEEQVIGILEGFIRKGRYVSVKNPLYRLLSGLWLLLLPVRDPIKRVVAFFKGN